MVDELLTVENAIKAFSEGLRIRYPYYFAFVERPVRFIRPASKETCEIFANTLMKQIDEFIQKEEHKIGDHISYFYSFGVIRSQNSRITGSPTESMSDNLEEAMRLLPEIARDEEYVLPSPSKMCFVFSESSHLLLDKQSSDWIIQKIIDNFQKRK